MVGDLLVRNALHHDKIRKVTVVTRSPIIGYDSTWLKEIVVSEFRDIIKSRIASERFDICFYCAGVYAGTLSRSGYAKSTVIPLMSISKVLKRYHPGMVFSYLSEYAPGWLPGFLTPYHLRIRRRLEENLLDQGFGQVQIFKPSYIYPVEPRTEPTTLSGLKRNLYKVVRHGVTSYQLVEAMLESSLQPNKKTCFINKDILNQLSDCKRKLEGSNSTKNEYTWFLHHKM